MVWPVPQNLGKEPAGVLVSLQQRPQRNGRLRPVGWAVELIGDLAVQETGIAAD